jgi:hypothetical protein
MKADVKDIFLPSRHGRDFFGSQYLAGLRARDPADPATNWDIACMCLFEIQTLQEALEIEIPSKL